MKRLIHCLVLVAAATTCVAALAGNDSPGNCGNGSGSGNACLPGVPGPVGPMGPQGPQGIPGESIKGDKGDPGEAGRDGVDGKDGESITGAAGKDAPQDAVTAQQMDGAVGTLAASTNAQVANLRQQLNDVSKAAYAGTAAALALQMPALNPHKPDALTMRLGVGSYKGQSAVGISFRRGNKLGDWSVSGGVSGSSQGAGVALGVEHSF
jgi:trimeric autotransporter adhesin